MTERICQFCGGNLDMSGHRPRCPARDPAPEAAPVGHDFDADGVCNRCGDFSESAPGSCPGWPEAAPVCTCEAHPPGDECGYACCTCPVHRNGACASEAAPVDAEAAAVWERLTLSMQDALLRAARYSDCVNCHHHVRLALTRRGLCARRKGPSAWEPFELTDLGKRVAAHGRSVKGGANG